MAEHALIKSAEKDEQKKRKNAQPQYSRLKEDGGEQCPITQTTFPSLSTSDAVLGLQQTFGNKYVQGLVEQKAEIADDTSDSVIASEARSMHGKGSYLPDNLRQRAENMLGENLGYVRVHADTEADHLVKKAGALAFTVGQDIFLRESIYDGDNSESNILAHEVVHTVQQKCGSELDPEHEAERLGRKIFIGETADLHSGQKNPVPALQRAGSARGNITINTAQIDYFDVLGTLSRVKRTLEVRAMMATWFGDWGHCEWRPTCDTRGDAQGNITEVDVNVSNDILLPWWEEASSAPAAARDEWFRMLGCLREHELHHAHLAEDYASTMQQSMIGTPISDTDANWKTQLDNLKVEEDKYDASTHNGQTEGVTLDDSKDTRAALETETEEAVAESEEEPPEEAEGEAETEA